jgi:NadR type nicotinamide-nucleotide adenylyltransferase
MFQAGNMLLREPLDGAGNRTSAVLKVVVTGSECVGKTTLARQLAERYGVPHSEEFARRYLDMKAAPLDASDVEPIARGQLTWEDAAIAAGADLVILDTDLLSTVVYARHYYGACPAWIERAARERRGGLYLLLHPDVPWVADGLKRDRPKARTEVHGRFRDLLAAWGARVVDVTGGWDRRRATAIVAVDACLASVRREREGNPG